MQSWAWISLKYINYLATSSQIDLRQSMPLTLFLSARPPMSCELPWGKVNTVCELLVGNMVLLRHYMFQELIFTVQYINQCTHQCTVFFGKFECQCTVHWMEVIGLKQMSIIYNQNWWVLKLLMMKKLTGKFLHKNNWNFLFCQGLIYL